MTRMDKQAPIADFYECFTTVMTFLFLLLSELLDLLSIFCTFCFFKFQTFSSKDTLVLILSIRVRIKDTVQEESEDIGNGVAQDEECMCYILRLVWFVSLTNI